MIHLQNGDQMEMYHSRPHSIGNGTTIWSPFWRVVTVKRVLFHYTIKREGRPNHIDRALNMRFTNSCFMGITIVMGAGPRWIIIMLTRRRALDEGNRSDKKWMNERNIHTMVVATKLVADGKCQTLEEAVKKIERSICRGRYHVTS